jgi:hypothetical protein
MNVCQYRLYTILEIMHCEASIVRWQLHREAVAPAL